MCVVCVVVPALVLLLASCAPGVSTPTTPKACGSAYAETQAYEAAYRNWQNHVRALRSAEQRWALNPLDPTIQTRAMGYLRASRDWERLHMQERISEAADALDEQRLRLELCELSRR